MYSTIVEIQASRSLLDRCSAAVAGEVTAGSVEGDTAFVTQWTAARSWDIAATPGWSADWESAVAGGITDPGANAAVISDAEILSRVQPLLVTYPLTDLTPPAPVVP